MKHEPAFERVDNWRGTPSSVAAWRRDGSPVCYDGAPVGTYEFFALTASNYPRLYVHGAPARVSWDISYNDAPGHSQQIASGYSETLEEAEECARELFDAVRRYTTCTGAPAYMHGYTCKAVRTGMRAVFDKALRAETRALGDGGRSS